MKRSYFAFGKAGTVPVCRKHTCCLMGAFEPHSFMLLQRGFSPPCTVHWELPLWTGLQQSCVWMTPKQNHLTDAKQRKADLKLHEMQQQLTTQHEKQHLRCYSVLWKYGVLYTSSLAHAFRNKELCWWHQFLSKFPHYVSYPLYASWTRQPRISLRQPEHLSSVHKVQVSFRIIK